MNRDEALARADAHVAALHKHAQRLTEAGNHGAADRAQSLIARLGIAKAKAVVDFEENAEALMPLLEEAANMLAEELS